MPPTAIVDPIARHADVALAMTERVLAATPSAEVLPPIGTVPAPVVMRRSRTASAVAGAATLGFLGVFALVKAGRSQAIDLAITLRLQGHDRPVVQRVMGAVSWPGFPPQSRIIPALAIAGLWLARLRLEAMAVAAGWGTALAATAIKAAVRRPRPLAGDRLQVVVAPLGGSSFPSGHVLTYVGVYGTLAYLAATLLRPVRVRRVVVGALLALVAAVGPSRIHQGHHWPTDVSASYLLGTAWVVVVTSTYRRRKARRAGTRP